MMKPELAPCLTRAFQVADTQAERFGHSVLTVAHIMLSVVDDAESKPVMAGIFEQALAKLGEVNHQADADATRDNFLARSALNTFQQQLVTHLREAEREEPMSSRRGRDADLREVMTFAEGRARGSRREQIMLADFFFGMWKTNNFVVGALRDLGVSRMDFVSFLAAPTPKVAQANGSGDSATGAGGAEPLVAAVGSYGGTTTRTQEDVLAQFCVNLGEQDAAHVHGRDDEIQDVIEILARHKKGNAVLVGDAGVGKTTVVQGIQERIKQGRVPASLKGASIYCLELGRIIGGTQFRGDLEARISKLIDALRSRDGIVLFIDEIHTLVGAGGANGGLDIANMLKPLLAGEARSCRIIGATTQAEYRRYFERDEAMARRFQKVDVLEPTVERTVGILTKALPTYERHHGVSYCPEAAEMAARLSDRFIRNRRLPDKAFDIIDDAASAVGSRGEAVVTPADIERAVAKMGRLPKLTTDATTSLRTLAARVKATIFNCDDTIDTIVRAVLRSRAELGEGGTVGSFLFHGSTGTGKTELSRQLAIEMGVPLHRLDMSEFSGPGAVMSLIGSPAGPDAERGGRLTEMVEQHPHAVLLMDEFDKANEEVHQLLLQVMDAGTLTDARGRTVDFRGILLVMTTNIGQAEEGRSSLGFGRDADLTKQAVVDFLSPEFRNRLDGVFHFAALTNDAKRSIVDKNLGELRASLAEKSITLNLSASARDLLMERGFRAGKSGRPLRAIIKNELKTRLAEAMLFEGLERGHHVRIDDVNGELKVTWAANDDVVVARSELEIVAA